MAITFKNLDFKTSKGLIPAIYCGKFENAKNIVIHLNIACGIKELIKFYNIPDFKHSVFLSIDLPGHGSCKIKPSRHPHYYIRIIHEIVDQIKAKDPNKKIIFFGESFGANLASLYCKKYFYENNQYILLNPPFKIRNPKKTKEEKNTDNTFKLACKYIFTLLTNIDTYSIPHGIHNLTNNIVFLRMWKMRAQENKQSTKINLATWFSMSKARKFILNHYEIDAMPQITLITSKEDFYYQKNKNTIDKLTSYKLKNNGIEIFSEGDHFLVINPSSQKEIWKIVLKHDK